MKLAQKEIRILSCADCLYYKKTGNNSQREDVVQACGHEEIANAPESQRAVSPHTMPFWCPMKGRVQAMIWGPGDPTGHR